MKTFEKIRALALAKHELRSTRVGIHLVSVVSVLLHSFLLSLGDLEQTVVSAKIVNVCFVVDTFNLDFGTIKNIRKVADYARKHAFHENR